MTWRQLQDQTAEFFRSLGCEAEVEASIAGARAEHRIDVWVRFMKFGLETKWVIECKDWNSSVPKEKVLALRSIVEDLGADRGVLLSAAGFQPGAVRAAEKTNITLTDLDGLRETAREDLVAFVVHQLETRAIELRYHLHNLYPLGRAGPNSWSPNPSLGVDTQAVLRAIGT